METATTSQRADVNYPLAFFQSVITTRKMTWSVSQIAESVQVSFLTSREFSRSGPLRSILSLHLGNVGRDVPAGGNPVRVSTYFELIYKCRRKLPSSRLLNARVGQRLQIAVVEQPHTVCAERVCR